jgi:two-component system cell cycle sensor histidine kinase/response regulator CckA
MQQHASPGQASSEPQNDRFTILVVEDEPAIRMIAADILRDAGYNVTETSTATEAMVVLSSHHIDLVFSDVLMPGSIGGLTLAGWIKTNRPKIPVILCSGISAVSRYLHGREGITFLAKPFGTNDLLGLVEQLLPRTGRER